MGLSDDDDDFAPSQSSERYFTQADRGKKEELKRQVERKRGVDASQKNLQELKSDLTHMQSGDTSPQKESVISDWEDKKTEKSSAPKTKTLKEREEDAVHTAQKKDSPDSLIEQQQRAQDVSDEETQSEPG